jgi:hypothetical protein
MSATCGRRGLDGVRDGMVGDLGGRAAAPADQELVRVVVVMPVAMPRIGAADIGVQALDLVDQPCSSRKSSAR